MSSRPMWFIALVLGSLAMGPSAAEAQGLTEKYRPQFHFSPKKGWMNDPNGLVYYDGEYHLFYQHDPNATDWGFCLSWGHAVSPDLIHWEHLPVAIAPEAGCSPGGGGAWSGSAAIDWNNTLGVQKGDVKTMVVMWTAYNKGGQYLAYSTDRGRTFTKYPKNPVLPTEGDPRDPQLFWDMARKRWNATYWENGGFRFASSADLKTWTKNGKFSGGGDAFYECPNLFSLPLDGKAGNEMWTIFGAHGLYFLGGFDGSVFSKTSGPFPLDNGISFYAGQMWNEIPAGDGRRINITWMAEAQYPGGDKPAFSQQMTVPTVFSLRTTPNGPRIFRAPVAAVEDIRVPGADKHWKDQALTEGMNPLSAIADELLDIDVVVEPGNATEIGLRIRGEDTNEIIYEVAKRTLTTKFPWASAKNKHGMRPAVLSVETRVHLRVLVDRTTVEVFANDGEATFSNLFLPGRSGVKAPELYVKGSGAKIVSLDVHPLRSIWTPGALDAAKAKAKPVAAADAGAADAGGADALTAVDARAETDALVPLATGGGAGTSGGAGGQGGRAAGPRDAAVFDAPSDVGDAASAGCACTTGRAASGGAGSAVLSVAWALLLARRRLLARRKRLCGQPPINQS